MDNVVTGFSPLHPRNWRRLQPDGSLPRPPKCGHTGVPKDNSMSSPGGFSVIKGETAGLRAFYLQIQIKQILKRGSLATLFPHSVRCCSLNLNNPGFIIE